MSFLLTTAMLLCIFATIITSFAYIAQTYHANYLCRKMVRHIEVTGQYDFYDIWTLYGELANEDLTIRNIHVDSDFIGSNKIQLRDDFTVTLEASYDIPLVQIGSEVTEISLPIKIKLEGMSEVFWK